MQILHQSEQMFQNRGFQVPGFRWQVAGGVRDSSGVLAGISGEAEGSELAGLGVEDGAMAVAEGVDDDEMATVGGKG